MQFYLGTHNASWLKYNELSPYFISHNRLKRYKNFKQAKSLWALDSGGFTQLSKYGTWTITSKEYVGAVIRYRDNIGNLKWVAPQDWMCEPFITAKTGLSVIQHQLNTVRNFIELKSIDDSLPIIPVLQGYSLLDYVRCWTMYDKYGINLLRYERVGIGSVCRRQNTNEIKNIITMLYSLGFNNLHGFGVKIQGLAKYGWMLKSADSMAWSFCGRREKTPCPNGNKNCANCYHYAKEWRSKIKT